jgi:hypothetical protein
MLLDFELPAMPTLDELLRVPRLKIKRAEHHVNDLNAQITRFLARRPYELVTVADQKTGEVLVGVKTKVPIPDDIPLTIGDAVHNMRSAMDILSFSMVGDRARKFKAVQFPFLESCESLGRAIENREIDFAGKRSLTRFWRSNLVRTGTKNSARCHPGFAG